MASAGPSNPINDQAAAWAVEVALGDMTSESRAELDAWLAADRRHQGAFVRANAWLQATEDAVAGASAIRPPAQPAPRLSDNDNGFGQNEVARRGLRPGYRAKAVGVAAAVTACASVLVATGIVPLPFDAREQTARPEVFALADGSTATLRDGARIEVGLTPDIRRITLRSGEATFEVAKDKTRPFVVRSGDVYAQATGTVYSVSRVGATGGTVKVVEGSVLVWPRDDRDQAVLLRAGGSITLDPGPMPAPRTAPATRRPSSLPAPELAQISLDNVTVNSAVARFNQVNATKIVVADPEVGKMRIIGLYRANDPEQFARAVAAISEGTIDVSKDLIAIKLK